MAFINCGAYVNGARPKTKKALRVAMADPHAHVVLDGTSAFGTANYNPKDGSRPTDTFVVVGPDPYSKRNWYANIINGKVT